MSRWSESPSRHVRGLIVLSLMAATACQDASEQAEVQGVSEGDAAVELWSHPDSIGIEIYTPVDLKAESRDVAWGIDRVAGAIMRFAPASGEFGVFGFLAGQPSEVAAPMRLAVSETGGIVAFDDSTGMVDTFTPGGQHVRGFDPGFRPSVLEVASDPLRLTFGITVPDADSLPRLMVIQTDFLGQNPDTLLAPGIGPETLQGVIARGGFMMVAPSESGLWVFSRQVPDTVFEISALGPGRRMVFPESDSTRVGVISDLDEQILWIVSPRAEGGLDYEAYDVSGTGQGEVFEAVPRYLGARTTPADYVGKVAVEGAMIGWWRVGTKVVPRAYDMLVPQLRDGAEAARAARDSRREENARKWQTLREEAARAVEEGQAPVEPEVD